MRLFAVVGTVLLVLLVVAAVAGEHNGFGLFIGLD